MMRKKGQKPGKKGAIKSAPAKETMRDASDMMKKAVTDMRKHKKSLGLGMHDTLSTSTSVGY